MSTDIKNQAIELRKSGYSYSDIINSIKVPKSTLASWLSKVPLSDSEKLLLKKRLVTKRKEAAERAGLTHRRQRSDRDAELVKELKGASPTLLADPFFTFGLALYWGQGTQIGTGFSFISSNPDMVDLMSAWIEKYLGFSRKNQNARLFVSSPYTHAKLEDFWSKRIGIPLGNFRRTVYKTGNRKNKKMIQYKGILRITMRSSTINLRKMLFLQSLTIQHFKFQSVRQAMRP
jgi:hypothetical protein